jgi:hypothetical protein
VGGDGLAGEVGEGVFEGVFFLGCAVGFAAGRGNADPGLLGGGGYYRHCGRRMSRVVGRGEEVRSVVGVVDGGGFNLMLMAMLLSVEDGGEGGFEGAGLQKRRSRREDKRLWKGVCCPTLSVPSLPGLMCGWLEACLRSLDLVLPGTPVIPGMSWSGRRFSGTAVSCYWEGFRCPFLLWVRSIPIEFRQPDLHRSRARSRPFLRAHFKQRIHVGELTVSYRSSTSALPV